MIHSMVCDIGIMLSSGVELLQGIMLASVLLATNVDVYIARAQRRDLGLCEYCGGVYEPEKCNAGDCPVKKKKKS